MRKRLTSIVALSVGAAAVAIAVQVASQPANAAASDPYVFKNVAIGGGGLITGIVFNEGASNIIYSRTDIGGMYRWNQSTSSWTPLLDGVGWGNWSDNGVVSIAADPVNTNKVYAAVGMYTVAAWDPTMGAIMRSSDQGATWSVTRLPFLLGGNMPARGIGERLAVDPNKPSILYFAAPNGNGLWRSTDSAVTWSQVTAFPNPGNYIQIPGDTYQGQTAGVLWVAFDKSTGTSGNTTQGIYVGVADKNNSVYRSTNGGTSWSLVSGAPTGYIPHKGVVDPVNHVLYIATSDTNGPFDGAKGDVWKYNISTGAWTLISPVPSTSSDDYYGYSGLTIDRLHPSTIMVASQVSWWPDNIFFRSTDGGTTWTRAWDYTTYPSRSNRYVMDVSANPWLTFGSTPALPEMTPKLGWSSEAMQIDPFNSNRMMYGTGATLYGTTNLTNWDAGSQITISPMVKGLEETAIGDLISPPTGAPLFSGLGDIGGFKHDNLDTVPSLMYQSPAFGATLSLDYAELNSSVVVRAGSAASGGTSHVAVSTNGGSSWVTGTEPSGVTSGGTVAAAADGSRFVWAPGDTGQAVVYSANNGSTWTASTGVPANAVIESDRVNPLKFYALSGGTMYVSTNGGGNFTAKATGLPSVPSQFWALKFKAVFGREGDIWVAGPDPSMMATGSTVYGLFHSTDSGTTFTKVSNVTAAMNVGFGKAAPGQTYPAMYMIGTVDGVTGIYRSDNAGSAWVRINDDAHQYGNIGEGLTGDPRVYGRVYVGTNGRGVIYADKLSLTKIVGTQSGRCLDVPGSSQTNGTQTQIYDCGSGTNQQWTLTSSNQIMVYGTKCLEESGTTNGSKADITDCTSATSQKWSINSNGTITNAASGKCLDVTGKKTANGTLVEIYTCNGGTNQLFTRQ
jgi:hypothetical protein